MSPNNDPYADRAERLSRETSAVVEAAKKELEEMYVGKEVTLNLPGGTFRGRSFPPRKYHGRAAIITDVMYHAGRFLFLCMVTRSGTNPVDRDFLNSDGETRSCRPVDQFILMDD